MHLLTSFDAGRIVWGMTNSTQTMEEVRSMTSSEEFNGWPNRETWAASLHLSNDRGLYEMVNGWANDARAEAIEEAESDRDGWYASKITTVERTTSHLLADKLEDYIDGLRADIRDAARHPGFTRTETEVMMVLEIGSEWRVDWQHLAENWLDGFEFEEES